MITIESNNISDVIDEIFNVTKDFYFKKKSDLGFFLYYNPFLKKLSDNWSQYHLKILNDECITTESDYKDAISKAVAKDFTNINSNKLLTEDILGDSYEMDEYIGSLKEVEASYLFMTDLDKVALFTYEKYSFSRKELDIIFKDIYNSNSLSQNVLNFIQINCKIKYKDKIKTLINKVTKDVIVVNKRFNKYKFSYIFILAAIFVIGSVPIFIWGYSYNQSIIYAVAKVFIYLPLIYTFVFTISTFVLGEYMYLLFPNKTYDVIKDNYIIVERLNSN